MNSLNKQCENKLVSEILKLPPLMQDQLLDLSVKTLKKDIERKVRYKMSQEIKKYLGTVIEAELKRKNHQYISPSFIPYPEYEQWKNTLPSYIVNIGEIIAENLTTPMYKPVNSIPPTTNLTEEEYIHTQLEESDEEIF